MLPHQLYQFTTSKDSAIGRLEVVFTRTFDSQMAVSVTSPILYVPLDRVLQITNVHCIGEPQGGQNCLDIYVGVYDETGAIRMPVFGAKQGAGLGRLRADRQDLGWLPPNFGLSATAQFDAGVALNFCTLAVQGVLFPRGNVQIGALVSG